MRGKPARAPYSPCDIKPGEVWLSLSEGVSLSKSNDRPTATRVLLGQCFGVKSRPARMRLTMSKTLLLLSFLKVPFSGLYILCAVLAAMVYCVIVTVAW